MKRDFTALPTVISLVVLILATLNFLQPASGRNTGSGEESAIQVYYPKGDEIITAESTFLIGSCPQGAGLTANGDPVRTSVHGYFAHVLQLKPGLNTVTLETETGQRLVVTVKREEEPPILPADPLEIDPTFLYPQGSMGVGTGDIIRFAVRATPGADVHVEIGKTVVALSSPQSPRSPGMDNGGLDTAFGQVFQRFSAQRPDVYTGYYRVTDADSWKDQPLEIAVSRKRSSKKLKTGTLITTLDQPLTGRTILKDTVVRLGPGKARTTPLDSDIRLLVDGWADNQLRCLLSPGNHVWIKSQDIAIEHERSRQHGSLPMSFARTVNLEPASRSVRIVLPLTQRLPYRLRQELKPNQLVMDVFGVTADTDWVTRKNDPGLSASPVDHITWEQVSDNNYRLTVHLEEGRQDGFWAEYEGTNLVLNIKRPVYAKSSNLEGITICLDPGHGGPENGAMGPSGISEAEVNLQISRHLQKMLKESGARVIMTRTTTSEDPSLASRVQTAIDRSADLLVSIHSNALPDGRDPWKEHGSSTYWYYPQAIRPARIVKKHLLSRLKLPDFGTRYQNLALTRVSNMPAVLVEVGFMIHPDEYAKLIEPEFQKSAARAIADGISEYFRPNRKMSYE